MNNRLGQRCPHCQTWATVRHSVELSPTVRALYFHCRNTFCGHTWKSHLEIVSTISESAVANPAINLPLSPKSETLRLLAESRAHPGQAQLFGAPSHEPCRT